MKVLRRGATTLIVIAMTSGCASMAQQKKLTAFNNLYDSGQYAEAADLAIKEIGGKRACKSKLLQSLQAAAALRHAKEYQKSTLLFDECEEIIKYHNEKNLASSSISTAGTLLINDAVLDYMGAEYDGIMVNTYKALNFWQVGDKDLARIEFNRALDRQRRAKELFAAEIAKMKDDLDKKQEEENKKALSGKQGSPAIDFKKNINNPEIDTILQDKYSSLSEFKAYPDFINPFTTYVAGLFFMSEGDFSKATMLLKETYGMVEQNPTVQNDFSSLEHLNGKGLGKNHTWIIFENGLGPIKQEFRVDLPILLFTEKVKYTGIALPRLEFRNSAYSHLTVKNNEITLGQTHLLSSMDRVVQTEFNKKYPSIVTRAVTSALIKTSGQYFAQKELGSLGGFAAAIYQGATTAADIRIWSALPKEYQLAKFAAPSDGALVVETPTHDKISISVPNNKNSLVYVKIPETGAKIIYDVIEM